MKDYSPNSLYDESIPIEKILYSNFIKYASLPEMISKEFAGSKATTVNIFIDLNHFFMKAYQFLKVESYYAPTAIAINYGAHFRSYFRTRLGVYANIILVYSPNMSENNNRFYPQYNSSYINRMRSNERVMSMIVQNINVLRVLCPYLPNVYLREGSVEPGVIIKDLIDTDFNNGFPNIIISNSDYMLQVPGFLAAPTVVFRKDSKLKNGAFSYNAYSALNAYLYCSKHLDLNYPIPVDVPKRFVTLLMVLSGLPGRKVKSVFDYKHSIDILKYIPVTIYGNVEDMYDNVQKYMLSHTGRTTMSYKEFSDRFYALDVNFQWKLYRELPEYMDRSYLTRMNDPNEVKAINNKYFQKSPIDLERL